SDPAASGQSGRTRDPCTDRSAAETRARRRRGTARRARARWLPGPSACVLEHAAGRIVSFASEKPPDARVKQLAAATSLIGSSCGGDREMNDAFFWLIPVTAIAGGVAAGIVATITRGRIRELEIREGIA